MIGPVGDLGVDAGARRGAGFAGAVDHDGVIARRHAQAGHLRVDAAARAADIIAGAGDLDRPRAVRRRSASPRRAADLRGVVGDDRESVLRRGVDAIARVAGDIAGSTQSRGDRHSARTARLGVDAPGTRDGARGRNGDGAAVRKCADASPVEIAIGIGRDVSGMGDQDQAAVGLRSDAIARGVDG